MIYRTLSRTDIQVSSVCFGCWGIVGGFNWGPQDESGMAQFGLTSVIAGARTAEQASSIAHAADVRLPTDILTRLVQATEPLKLKLGKNPDMWQSESRMR